MISTFKCELRDVPLELINVDKYRVRDSIDEEHVDRICNDYKKTNVQIYPIHLREDNGTLELMDGKHRYLGAKKADKKTIRAFVWIGMSEEDAWILVSKIFTMQKKGKPIEEGRLILKLIENNHLSQKQIAIDLGRTESWVSSRLSLVLDCVQSVRKYVEQGKINFSVAKVISKLDRKEQKKFADRVIKNNWTLEKTKEQYELIVNPLTSETEESVDEVPPIEEKEQVISKAPYEIVKRTSKTITVNDTLFNNTCLIKINDLNNRDFYCIDHKGIFCASITKFLKTVDISVITAFPLSPDDPDLDELAKNYLYTEGESISPSLLDIGDSDISDVVTSSESILEEDEVISPDIDEEKLEVSTSTMDEVPSIFESGLAATLEGPKDTTVIIECSLPKNKYDKLQIYCNKKGKPIEEILITCIDKLLEK